MAGKAQALTASQHEQFQDPETEAAEWNLAVIRFVAYTCFYSCYNAMMSSLKIYRANSCKNNQRNEGKCILKCDKGDCKLATECYKYTIAGYIGYYRKSMRITYMECFCCGV